MLVDGSVYKYHLATEIPEVFVMPVGEGCDDAHDECEGFCKPRSEAVSPTNRIQCCMLHLIAWDLDKNQVFWVGLKGYGPFLWH